MLMRTASYSLLGADRQHCPAWALHDIATANIVFVWFMAYTRGVGWGSYITH